MFWVLKKGETLEKKCSWNALVMLLKLGNSPWQVVLLAMASKTGAGIALQLKFFVFWPFGELLSFFSRPVKPCSCQ
jgi:hypothetical protein